ncbi:MAG: hypothetical protein E6713_03070 [Sporomusaceae bacterium]|nr:hypothetical protein [Sporomusaceae bacterium]
MKKIILLIISFALFLPVCLADPQEFITEGTYVATDSDSPAQAEDAALNIAKRAALEQSGTLVQSSTTVENFQLRNDQIKSISSAVMETTILEKRRWYDGNALVFWVKIKSVVYPDKVIQAIKDGAFDSKKIIGALILYDPTHPANSPMPKEYPYEDHFPSGDKMFAPVKTAISEKYSTRNSSFELGAPVADKLLPYMSSLNIKNQLQLTDSDLIEFAKNSGYDYFIVATTKLSNFDHTATMFNDGGTFDIELETDIKIIDTASKSIFLNKAYIAKSRQYYSQGFGLMFDFSAYNKGIETAVDSASKKLADDLSKSLPSAAEITHRKNEIVNGL